MNWIIIPGYERLYEISDEGQVRSLDRVDSYGRLRAGRILRQAKVAHGYLKVSLSDCGNVQSFYVHRLVALAFLGDPNGLHVNHIDGDKHNNQMVNLEYVTHQQNLQHAVRLGLIPLGEQCGRSKLKEADVRLIRVLINRGKGNVEIANEFNVHRKTVGNIRNKKSWVAL